MRDSDRAQFAKYLAGVYALKGKEFTHMLADVWFRALQQYDLPAVLGAVNRHVVDPDRGQYVPTPADVVRLIEGGSGDRAILAWDVVMRAVQSVGIYGSVVFDCPFVMRALADMGGWCKLCMVTEKELPFVAKEFQARYRAHANTGRIPEHPQVLHGQADMENLPRGYPAQRPYLIGDQSRALALHEGKLAPESLPLIGRLPSPMLIEGRA